MRQTRNRAKRAARMVNRRRYPKRWGIEGPTCPTCSPHVNGALRRQTVLGRIHAREMDA